MDGKKLSNPFSSGNGGPHFEAHVQASFVALMLTGGYAPCMPCCPIEKIKLQGKVDGYDTDDFIVTVNSSGERQFLLAQVKYSIDITLKSKLFGEVMQAAWNDFNNAELFKRGRDAIALITGPLSATDERNVRFLLSQARSTSSPDEFFRNVDTANFSPTDAPKKLQAFQHHLKVANGGRDVSKSELIEFFQHFHLLGYDLGEEFGVTLSLLHSHMSQYPGSAPKWVWSRLVDIVQTRNKSAGTVTRENLPDDIRNIFKQRALAEIPRELLVFDGNKPGYSALPRPTAWDQHSDASLLALAVLVGTWNEKNESDTRVLSAALGIDYEEWLKKAQEILHIDESPLKLVNGIWSVENKAQLWVLLGVRILDRNLDVFSKLAFEVLSEMDPALDLPIDERYAAGIYGKTKKFSDEIRKGIAEGLAILGSNPGPCTHCSLGKVEEISVLTIRNLLSSDQWQLWGSLDDLLPLLSEAAPSEFLRCVEKALQCKPCPFDELFAQEGRGVFGRTYLSGLLWALEGLAWSEDFLVPSVVILGELANHDPGGQWANRPANSLATILLPWFPQTLASIDKRKAAVKTLLKEFPDVGWKLLIELLPGRHQTSSGTHKPRWRLLIADDFNGQGVPHGEYWDQSEFYSNLAVESAATKIDKLVELVENITNIPKDAFLQLVATLSSDAVTSLPEEERLVIWNTLIKQTHKHRRFIDAGWALPDEAIANLEKVASLLEPKNPFNLHQHLFSDREFDLHDDSSSWEEQRNKISDRRINALSDVFKAGGPDEVLRLVQVVESPRLVGSAAGLLADNYLDRQYLPVLLDSENRKIKAFVGSYVWQRFQVAKWDWCYDLDVDRWTDSQKTGLLINLPFERLTWQQAERWLGKEEVKYWRHVYANPYEAGKDVEIAIDKLLQFDRPYAAISCLSYMLYGRQPMQVVKVAEVLLAALRSDDSPYGTEDYHVIELIKWMQENALGDDNLLFQVEWAYLPLLSGTRGATPQVLSNKLAAEPGFFAEVVRLIYKSRTHEAKEPSDEEKAIASNAWRLLHEWKIVPGTMRDGTFSSAAFNAWLAAVKEDATKSGHLDSALINIGQVLVHAPADTDGLWIDRAIAAALNDRDAEPMRSGYVTGIYNARGAHWVDPTGALEKELAVKFQQKADEAENAGYQRLAGSLRGIAKGYQRQAALVELEHLSQG